MVNTKKYIKILSLVAIIGFILAAVMFITKKAEEVDAAVVSQVVYTDSFDSKDGALTDKWSTFGGAKLKADYNAMRFNTEKYVWGGHVLNGGYFLDYDKINTSCTVEFVTRRIVDGGQWFAFSFGTNDLAFEFPHASGALIFYSETSEMAGTEAGVLAPKSGNSKNFSIFHTDESGEHLKVIVKIIFTKESTDKDYNVNAYCYDFNNPSTVLSHYNFGSIKIKNGYFGFNSAQLKIDIFSFKVYEDNNNGPTYNTDSQPVYVDNFTDSAISYITEAEENPTWYANSAWDKNNLLLGVMGKLDITASGSGAVYSVPVSEPENNQLYLLYGFSADFYVKDMARADSGFIIGADANGNGGTFVGLRKTAGNPRIVSYIEGSSEIKFGGNDGSDYFSDSLISVGVKVFSDNKIEVSVGTKVYEFTANKVDGYFGFKTLGDNNGAFVDNFEYFNNKYVERKSGDLKTNFEDTIKTETTVGTVYDNYCSTKDWFMSSGIKFPTIKGDNNYLIFSNAGDYCCFAPKNKYTDYIVRFDVTFISINNGSTFGIQVGKTDISEGFSNSVCFGFQNQGDLTYYYSNKYVSSEGKFADVIKKPFNNEAIENMFIAGETYNFMAVVYNGTVKLYLKKSTDDDSVLSYERARFVDVKTDGYVAMFAYSVSLRLDNFSVTNLDYEYFTDGYDGGENLQTFRYDFSTGTGLQDFSAVSGGTFKKDKTIEVVRGSEGVVTNGKVGANITRIKFADVEAGAIYTHGNVTVKMDEANNRIVLSDGKNYKYVNLGDGFQYKDSMLQIEETLGKVALSFVSGDKPIPAISGNFYEFEVENYDTNKVIAQNKISITSPYIAKVKELSVFNLDTNVKITSSVFVPESVRVVKKAIQDKGCSSATDGGIYAFLTFGLAAALIVTLKRRHRNG